MAYGLQKVKISYFLLKYSRSRVVMAWEKWSLKNLVWKGFSCFILAGSSFKNIIASPFSKMFLRAFHPVFSCLRPFFISPVMNHIGWILKEIAFHRK